MKPQNESKVYQIDSDSADEKKKNNKYEHANDARFPNYEREGAIGMHPSSYGSML